MNIKSLLLGSAAVLVAATGAKAADAVVVAEPEPVEYVRVCDAYGSGFFYIPGTETCLSISGYVWFQIAASGNQVAGADTGAAFSSANTWGVSSRARLNFDARSDTEWGTLRGFIRVQSTFNAYSAAAVPGIVGGPNGTGSRDGNATIDQAFIELGGFRMGYSESAWAQTQGGGASNWGSHSWHGMYYGYQQRQLIAYTLQGGNGFFGTISVENDANGNYTPDVVAKIGVNQGWGAVWAKVGYDEDTGTNAVLSGADGWGASLGVQFNIPNSSGSSIRLIGFYADNANAYNAGAPGVAGGTVLGGAEYSILASYNHAFSSTLSASVAVQYFSDLYAGVASTGIDAIGAELSIVWFPVTNFEVRAEIHYDDILDPVSAARGGNGTNPDGSTSGYLRFTRYF